MGGCAELTGGWAAGLDAWEVFLQPVKALERMGYKGKMTGHGFRGIASTLLHEQGYDHQHIELQLAHTERNAVSASYNHAQYLLPRAKMMQDWADHLDSVRRGAKIIPLKAA